MKRFYSIAIIYTIIMGIGIFICKNFKDVSYLDSNFINTFMPFLIILAIFSIICYKKCKKKIDEYRPRYTAFMLLFVPVMLISLFTIVQKFELSKSFFIPLIGALLVGLNEELIYRGVIFSNAAEKRGITKAVFISSLTFSLLHAVNILGGLSPASVITQLITTFIAGIFLSLSYKNIKNIWLIVVYHGLWDYISLSGIGKVYPIIDTIIVVLMIIEIIVSLFMLRNIRKNIV